MKYRYIILAAAVFPLFLAGFILIKKDQARPVKNINPREWVDFKSENLKFRVDFPHKPAKYQNTIVIGRDASKTTWTSFVSELDTIIYRVDHVPLTKDVDLTDREKAVLGLSKLTIALLSPAASNNPLNAKSIRSQDYIGLEYSFKSSDHTGMFYTRTILTDREIFSVSVEAKNAEENNRNNFFNSFTLIR